GSRGSDPPAPPRAPARDASRPRTVGSRGRSRPCRRRRSRSRIHSCRLRENPGSRNMNLTVRDMRESIAIRAATVYIASQREAASRRIASDAALRPRQGEIMKFKALARAAVAAASVMLACSSVQAQTAQQPAKFRIQTAVPSASIYFQLLKNFGDRVDKMSGGRVKMEMLPDGAIVPAFEILDAVDKGIVEGGYAWTHYWSGKHPAAGLFSNPMAG